MPKKGEKILTQKQVKKLGLDKVAVITADMLEGYTSIGNYAFADCAGLISIEFPNSITSIGRASFAFCTGLTSIEIPNGVTRIGSFAFWSCNGLSSVNIPNSVTSIECSAFYNCSSLTSIVIPDSVTSIGWNVFGVCKNLASVTIPNSIKSIGGDAFYRCNNLTSVKIGDKIYKSQIVTNGKCKAYKALNANMICRGFQYEEGKTYELKGEPEICKQGFHACLNLANIFTYYWGKIGKDIVVHEVELEGVSDERHNDSKVVAKKITIGKRIL